MKNLYLGQGGGPLFAQVKILSQYKQSKLGDYTAVAIEEQQHMSDIEKLFDVESKEISKKTERTIFSMFVGAEDENSSPKTQNIFPQLLQSKREFVENENVWQKQHFQNCFSYLDDREKRENKVLKAFPRRIRARWSRAAFVVSVISIFTTLGFSMTSFAASHVTLSSSMFASAFDALLGSFNSIIVAWRFHDTLNGKLAPKREKAACFVIALSFIIGGVCMGIESSFRLAHHDHALKPDVLLIILSTSFICFLLLFYAQNCIALKLKSASMKASAVDSALAALMSVGIFTSTYLYRVHPGAWYLDHSVAVIIGLTSVVYGLKLLFNVTCGRKKHVG